MLTRIQSELLSIAMPPSWMFWEPLIFPEIERMKEEGLEFKSTQRLSVGGKRNKHRERLSSALPALLEGALSINVISDFSRINTWKENPLPCVSVQLRWRLKLFQKRSCSLWTHHSQPLGPRVCIPLCAALLYRAQLCAHFPLKHLCTRRALGEGKQDCTSQRYLLALDLLLQYSALPQPALPLVC